MRYHRCGTCYSYVSLKVVSVIICCIFFYLVPIAGAETDRFVTIVDSTMPFFSDPEGTIPAGNAGTGNFGKSFTVLKTYNEYVQISCDDREVWINAASTNDSILMNDQYKNYIEAEKESKVTRKALVVNSFNSKDFNSRVQFFHTRNLSGNPLDSVTIFEVRYVYKMSDAAILVGRSDRFVQDTSQDTLDGWIDKKNVVIWNNKIGFEFNKDNFEERKSCELGKISLRTGLDTTEPIYTESESIHWMKYYSNRFPVLRKSGDESYKVAYIGSAKGSAAGTSQTGKQYSKEQIEEMKQTMDQVINTDRVQIAILIDATKGMENHIMNVKNALNSFIRHLQEITSIRIEMSLAVYRDYPDGDKIYEVFSDFTDNFETVIDGLMKINVYSNPNDKGEGTYPEAVFFGIEQTILNHSWHRHGAEGFILLVGDHGNHEKSRVQYPQDARLSTMGIGEQLKDNRITLNAVQVNISDSRRQFNEMFKRQINEIQQYNKGFGNLVEVRANSTQEIENALNQSMSIFEDIQKVMYDARASQGGGPARETRESVLDDFSGYSGVYAQQIFSRYGIDPSLFSMVQICSLGHVNQKNRCGDKQIALRVLMTKKEVESLKTQMTELSDSIVYYEPETADDFERTIYRVVKSLTGDRISPHEGISEFIERKSGIPIQTSFLSFSMEELLEKIRDEEIRREFRKILQLKLLRLEEITRERKIIVGNWDYSFQDYEWQDCEGEGCQIDYFFSLDQPLRYRGKVMVSNSKRKHVWVPLSYLP